MNVDDVTGTFGRHDLGVEFEFDALFGKNALEILGHFHVDAQAAHVTQELHTRNLGPQTLPDRTLNRERKGNKFFSAIIIIRNGTNALRIQSKW